MSMEQNNPPAGGALAKPVQSPYLPSDPQDYAMPEIRLAQAMSKAVQDSEGEIRAGKFYCPQTMEQFEEFKAIVLRVQPTRALFPEDLGGPRCASDDGVMPRPDMEFEGPCYKCPMALDSPWSVDSTERRKRCLRGFTVLLVTPETNEPYIYRAHGTSIGPLRSLNTAYRTKLKGKPFAAVTKFDPQSTSNNLGTFYVNRLTLGEILPEEVVAEYEAIAQEFIEVTLTAADEADESEYSTGENQAGPQGLETFVGKLTSEPELRYTQAGVPVCKFYMVSEHITETLGDSAITCILWEDLAEQANQLLNVGERVSVTGAWKERDVSGTMVRELNLRTYEKITPVAEEAPPAEVNSTLPPLPETVAPPAVEVPPQQPALSNTPPEPVEPATPPVPETPPVTPPEDPFATPGGNLPF